MKLTSPRFDYGKKIPEDYTCDRENVSPHLEISEVPIKAKSLVLIMEDPDIPDFVKEKYNIQIWVHWVVFNIPPNTKTIEEGKNPEGVLGVSTSGKPFYTGPCPPDKEHRYFFKLFALDTTLNLKKEATKKQVEELMKGHIIKEAILMGTYKRKTN